MNSDFQNTSLKVSKTQADDLIAGWSRYAYKVRIEQEVGTSRLPHQYATIPTEDLYEIVAHSTERRYGMGKVYSGSEVGDYALKQRLEIRVGKVTYGFYLDGTF